MHVNNQRQTYDFGIEPIEGEFRTSADTLRGPHDETLLLVSLTLLFMSASPALAKPPQSSQTAGATNANGNAQLSLGAKAVGRAAIFTIGHQAVPETDIHETS